MLLLLIPFTLLLVLEAVKYYLLSACLDRLAALPQHPLYRFKGLNIKWYRWLLHSFKDWLVLGVLGLIAIWGLRRQVALLLPLGMASLGLLLLIRSFAPVVLWLFAAGARVPDSLLRLALNRALPSPGLVTRKRVLYWGGAFVLSGSACLWGWCVGGGIGSLLWSLLTLVLGFISLLRAMCNSGELGAKGIAERAG